MPTDYMPPPRVTTCTGRGHSVAAPLQAALFVIYGCYSLYTVTSNVGDPLSPTRQSPIFLCVYLFLFLSRVSMQSAILLWQICPSVRPSHSGIVCKRCIYRQTFSTFCPGHYASVFEGYRRYKISRGTPSEGR